MDEKLKRGIGVFGLATAVVNMTIGAGIFVLPALAAENLGAAAILCFVICGFAMFLIALCFAEIGSKVTTSGGVYTYIEKAFGPFAGFLSNYMFVFGCCVLSDAAIANALSSTLTHFFPYLATDWIRIMFFIVLFSGLAFINIRGVQHGLRFVMFTAFAKLIPLILIIGFGLGQISYDNLKWAEIPTMQNIGAGTLILFFTFLGVEGTVSNGGEFKNPSKTVPMGIISGLTFIILIYIAIQTVSQGILGDELQNFKDAPVTEVATRLFGSVGITIVVLGIAVSMLGGLGGSMLSIPRLAFAGAKNGIYPHLMSNVHPDFKTPYWAIIVYASFGCILAIVGGLKQLVILSSATALFIYLGVVFSTIKLRYQKNESSEKTFVTPGGLLVPILACIIILWILSNLSKEEFIGILVFISILSVAYYIMQKIKKKII